mmetsp:Transcript_6364/g.15346  ORF Transcript_6364/g.15346 Transcript_6364/m.15346 type:complete len:1312 (-) Transcript_6364:168-4103(-)
MQPPEPPTAAFAGLAGALAGQASEIAGSATSGAASLAANAANSASGAAAAGMGVADGLQGQAQMAQAAGASAIGGLGNQAQMAMGGLTSQAQMAQAAALGGVSGRMNQVGAAAVLLPNAVGGLGGRLPQLNVATGVAGNEVDEVQQRINMLQMEGAKNSGVFGNFDLSGLQDDLGDLSPKIREPIRRDQTLPNATPYIEGSYQSVQEFSNRAAAVGGAAASLAEAKMKEASQQKATPRTHSKLSPEQLRAREQERELETLRVNTMQGMVTKVSLTVGNVPMTCKFLYLSNQAVTLMTTSSMPRVAAELGLQDFRQIIRLMPARCGTMGWNSCAFWDDKFPYRKKPELNMVEREKSEHQLLLLARHLLKLAVDTNALVIGNDSCALVEAFLRVAAPVQRQYKDNCPFKLLIFARAFMCHKTATEGFGAGTVAGKFRERCRFWRDSKADFDVAMTARFGDDTAWWPRQELYTGEYSMIMFECVDQESNKLTESVFLEFQNDFMVAYSHLPAVALQMYGQWRFMGNADTIRDFVEQGNQLLLLDSRDRAAYNNPKWAEVGEEDEAEECRWNIPDDLYETIYGNALLNTPGIQELQEAHQDLGKFARLLHTKAEDGPRLDQYDASALAYVKKKMQDRYEKEAGNHSDGDTSKQKKYFLWEAIIRKGQSKDHESQKKVKGAEDEAKRRQKELIAAARLLMMYLGHEQEWESRMRHQFCIDCIDKLKTAKSFEDLKKYLREGTVGFSFLFHYQQALYDFAKANAAWFEVVKHPKPTKHGTSELVIKDLRSNEDLPAAVEAVSAFLSKQQQKGQTRFFPGETMLAFAADEEKWLAIYDLIKSRYVHTGNLHDLKEIEHKLEMMAITDRLPKENSMEALVLIRRGWTLVDIFKVNGTWYKRLAKISYAFLLVIGITIVCITVWTANFKNEKEGLDEDLSQRILLLVALLGSFITGLVTMLDPTRKWLQLRGAQLGLESEIWQFRTRSGEYMSTATMSLGRNEEEHRAASLFKRSMLMTYGKLQQSAGLSDTSFFALSTTTDDVEDIFQFDDEGPAPAKPGKKPKTAWESRSTKLKGMERKVRFTHKQYNANFIDDMKRLADAEGQCRRLLEKRSRADPQQVVAQDLEIGKVMGVVSDLRPLEGEDNHHSPVDPDNYIRWRLMPAVHYYHLQIPVYAWRRRMFQALIMLSSIGVACLAALQYAEWTAIVSSCSVALAAWQEFVGYAKKLERYSSVAAALENHLTWWQSLRPTDKLNSQLQGLLVQNTEDLLTSEYSAWMSDAQQAAKMLKDASTGPGGKKEENSAAQGRAAGAQEERKDK